MFYSYTNFDTDVCTVERTIRSKYHPYSSIYAVLRGGMVFGAVLAARLDLPLISNADMINSETLIVDDIIDSGETRNKFRDNDFIALIGRPARPDDSSQSLTMFVRQVPENEWVHFFWEGEKEESSITDSVTRMLQFIGEDVEREGLKETPERVVKAWKHIFSGYTIDPKTLIKEFSADGYDQMIILKDIELYSMCEHHLLPFIGKAHIAYIPNDKVIGVSKLARILEVFARRAQIQERIGDQVTEILMNELNAKGAGCIIEAQHLCMQMRGVQKQHSVMVTSSLKGVFLSDQETRLEFINLVRK